MDGSVIQVKTLLYDERTGKNEFTTQSAVVRKAAGENRFNVELENGITHWGVTAEQVQEMKA